MEQKFGIFVANGEEHIWGPNGLRAKGLSMLPIKPIKSIELAKGMIEEDESLKNGTGPYFIIPVTRYRKGSGEY